MEFRELLQKVADALELTPEQILEPSRKRKMVEARCILYLFLDQQHEHPADIAERFRQHRLTVINGLAKAHNMLTFDRYFKAKYQKCKKAIQEVKQ